jgi:Flp pilus assembly protein TadG
MAEFALITPLFLMMLFMAITFGVIGQAALAVGQLAYNGARYAAVNPTHTSGQISSYIRSGNLGSPTITSGGGSNLTVTVAQASGFGEPVTVTISYDLSSNPLVSSMSAMFSALGMAGTLPTTLTATQIAMSE